MAAEEFTEFLCSCWILLQIVVTLSQPVTSFSRVGSVGINFEVLLEVRNRLCVFLLGVQ
jgi:hypothetical protein